MPAFAFGRIRRIEIMPGMFVVSQQAALANVIDDLVLIAEYRGALNLNRGFLWFAHGRLCGAGGNVRAIFLRGK